MPIWMIGLMRWKAARSSLVISSSRNARFGERPESREMREAWFRSLPPELREELVQVGKL